MYIAAKPNAAPIAAQLYSLALKHHDFFKQEIKNILDARIICNSRSQWASPIVIIKSTHLKVHHSSSTCAQTTEN